MSRIRQIASVFIPLLLLSFCIWSITRELQEYSLKEIDSYLAQIPRNRKLEAIALTVLGYLTISPCSLALPSATASTPVGESPPSKLPR